MESAKVWPRFQKKRFKILFEKTETIGRAQSGMIGSLKADTGIVLGSVSKAELAGLKKVDELHAYHEKRDTDMKARFSSTQSEKPGLILDLGAA